MLNTNIEKYEEMTRKEAMMDYDWGYDIAKDSMVYRWESEDNIIMMGIDTDGTWCCEIEGFEDAVARKLWNLIGSGWGDTAEQALAMAVMEIIGNDVLRVEDNCEDASNVAAREAYVYIFGEVPYCEMEADKVDWLMGAACEYVKENGHYYGIEWEEYRW